jgi:4-hydroxybenzoate polyprenyltransferase
MALPLGVAIGRFARVQTAAAEMVVFATFAYLSGWSWQWLPLWMVWGVLAHSSGFMHNNLRNYRWDIRSKGTDKSPLVTGDLTMRQGWAIWGVFTAAGVGLFVYLAQVSGDHLLAYLFLALYIVVGMAYNESKGWPKAIGHALMGPSYALAGLAVMLTGHPGGLLLPLALWLGAFALLDNVAWGDAKDIEDENESNVLRDLGARVRGGFLIHTRKSSGLIYGIGWLRALSLLWVGYTIYPVTQSPGTLWFLCVFMIGTVSMFYFLHRMVRTQRWDRIHLVRMAGFMEPLWCIALVATLSPLLGWELSVFVIVAPLVVFTLSNKFLWGSGTYWAAKV